jgi:hypothetical protein
VANGAIGQIVNSGYAFVLLEAALAPVAGDPLWVSGTVAGRATNVMPAITAYVGVIKDASMYAATGGVMADLTPNFALSVPLNTLNTVYNAGVAWADQTMILSNAHGGGVAINATNPALVGVTVTAFEIDVIGGATNFYVVGGFDVSSSISRAAIPGAVWNEVAFLSSTLTLTGGPAVVTAAAMVHVGAGVINGPGNTVSDAYDLLVDAGPAGTATVTRSWSFGAVGAVQAQLGLVLGTALNPPTENDLVMGTGATVVSQANTGRLGYLAGGTQQFMVSMNGGAYVPLLYGPAAGGFTTGSVPFGSAIGTLTQDNANFYFHDANNTLQLGGAAPSANASLAILASKTIAAPVAISVWNGLDFQASTLTLTAGGVAPNRLDAVYLAAPVITQTAGAVYTVVQASTVTIAGPPTASAGGGATPVLSFPASLRILTGPLCIGTANPAGAAYNNGSIVTDRAICSFGLSKNLLVSDGNTYFGTIASTAAGESWVLGCTASIVAAAVPVLEWTSLYNVLIGVPYASQVATSKLQVQADKTIAVPAAIDTWKGFNFVTSTLTLTAGGVAPNSLSAAYFAAPVITSAGAYVIPAAATVTIAGSPTAGGALTITNPLALFVATGQVAIRDGSALAQWSPADSVLDVYAKNMFVYVDSDGVGEWGLKMRGNNAGVWQDIFRFTANGGSGQIYCGSTHGSYFLTLYAGNAEVARCTTSLNFLLGTTTDYATSRLHMVANKTIAVPAAIDTWKGFNFDTSTLTLTAGGVAPTSLSAAYFAAPVITSAGAYVIPAAATVTIAGPPTAGGALTITATLALNILSGALQSAGQFYTTLTGGGPAAGMKSQSTCWEYIGGAANAKYWDVQAGGNVLNWRTVNDANDAAVTFLTVTRNATTSITSVSWAAEQFAVTASKSVVAAAGAVWDGIKFAASTLTWTGATTPVTAAAFFNVEGPTITAASAVVTTDFATCKIGVASVAGSATITNNWCIWSLGAIRCDGRMEETRGANIGAATDIALGEDGNSFGITIGTGVLDRIATARWRAGSVVALHFAAAVAVSSGTAASATHAGLRLAGSVPLAAVADTLLVLLFDGTWWQEIGRKVA